jgi:hypothetical protein
MKMQSVTFSRHVAVHATTKVLELQILKVCSIIAKKAAPILYSNNKFAFLTFSNSIAFSNTLQPQLCGLVR